MPFAGYPDFEACLRDQRGKGHDEESARRICGKLQAEAEMSEAFNNQWIEIFRAGDYGPKGRWTEEDVEKVVRNFDAKTWQPVAIPAQLGHRDDAPALGLVRALRREGPSLFAQFERVDPALERLVREGRYPNRSAGFYVDPQGKGPVLRHVAFLGAMPPEVKGLAPVKFSDGDYVSIEFKEEDSMNEQPQLSKEQVGILTRFVEGLRSVFGGGDPRPAPDEAKFQEMVGGAVKAAVEPLQKQLTTVSEENKKLRDELAAGSARARVSEIRQFAESQKQAGKWVPALDALLPLIEQAAESGRTVKFTEGTGDKAKETEITPAEAFRRFAESLGQIVPLGEMAAGKRRRAGKNVVEFTEARNISLDELSVALRDRALEIQEKNPKISFGECLRRARHEMGQSAAAAGGISAGGA